MTRGVKLDWTASYGQLKEVLRQQCKVTSDQDIVLIMLHSNLFFRDMNGWRCAVAQYINMLWFLQTHIPPRYGSFSVSSGLNHSKH